MKYYNESVKNRFLDSIENEGTRHVISYIFLASKSTEESLEKDLYNFSLAEISSIMYNLSPKTSNSTKANMSNIRTYISFCIRHGYRDNNLNPLDSVNNKWSLQFIDRATKIHYSLEELTALIEDLDNDQDKCMILLWFAGGVQGKQFSELRNLTWYDVDWVNNILTLIDKDGSDRTLELGNDELALKCMEYLKKAKEQKTYKVYKNGEIVEIPLCESDFIFRNVKSKNTKDEEIGLNVIYTRLATIKEEYRLDTLSPKAISQSGQIYMCYKIYMRDGHFDSIGGEQWYEIGERYNVSKLKSSYGSGSYYVNVNLMKQYITTENLKELYDVDIPIETRKKNKKPSK